MKIIEDMATVLQVSVLVNGTVLLDGNPVTLEALAQAMDAVPNGGTQVWYYRENSARRRRRRSRWMKLIVERRLPIRLSAKPDFGRPVAGRGRVGGSFGYGACIRAFPGRQLVIVGPMGDKWR